MKRTLLAMVALAVAPAIAFAQGGPGRSGLTHAQIMELQRSINAAGCHAGPVDGIMGPQTEQGIECYRQQKGLAGNAGEMYQSLGMRVSDTAGTYLVSSSGEIYSGSGSANGTENVRGTARQTGGENYGRIRPTADSAAAYRNSASQNNANEKNATSGAVTSSANGSVTSNDSMNMSDTTRRSHRFRQQTDSLRRARAHERAHSGTGDAQNPASHAPLTVSPEDSTKIGVPSTRQTWKKDSLRAVRDSMRRDTTTPPQH